ncbi:biotin--[acetyl-CoA-carboxylase] ligase [Rhodohalobacter mucosus]|uniref:Biotin--[acetyl-CoA-carboxylase] ligase n=1 Tax=Rhodohalobacter mucosus TaxID=2079485 RepID=A0A316TS41_9BACT|nr:biotin--[acetyl-CoA-carboxylase] ligase [Rhodohalobacter mucosus]PWN07367.1 biotin--[acetyl-CoA-carboxylase] ligase [Rhodohalobacter mucosus]
MKQPFDVDLLNSRLSSSWLGRKFIHMDQVESTNSYLKKLPGDKLVHGTVLHTDHQTGGRGQYKRIWHSGPNQNLTFTIAFRPSHADRVPLLTLACAHAVSEALSGFSNEPVLIKWPNDLIAGGKKLGGILTECIFLGNKPDRILIGLGLNIFKEGYEGVSPEQAVCLEELNDESAELKREEILAKCLKAIEKAYLQWEKQDPQLHNTVSRRLIGYGQWVRIAINGRPEDGRFKFLGVNREGELTALNEELDVNTFKHGQVRILTGNEDVS